MTSSDRRDVAARRTLRPDADDVDATGLAALPTVADAIADPAFMAGDPEVIAGRNALVNRVRWVHASDNADVARFFAGGELLISTGQGWPAADSALAAFVDGLAAAGIAGIVLELGTRFAQAPVALVDAATRVGLPLVVLRSEVRFVDLTEAIHRRIIGSQMEALRAHAEVRERFTALALRGAPADHVVSQLARTLSSPVVLENLAHEVVAAEVVDGADAEVLADWERRSRAAAALAPGDTDWLIVPVDARGTRWGTLVALPGKPHPAGRLSVLEQGAIALAIGCLAAGGDEEWNRISRRGLLEGLLDGRFATTADAAARLESAGLPVTGRALHGIALASTDASPADVESAARAMGGAARALSLDAGEQGAMVALLSMPAGRGLDRESALALLKTIDGGARATMTIGRAATSAEEALASMRDAIDHARNDDAGGGATGGRVRWADERPLAHLLNSLRDDHRLLDHGERMLAPLIEHDARTGGDLQVVLAAMLAHPSNRTAAAKASHLSRSVFYQRLAIIASLLDADLDDGETQTALHIALLARRGRRG
ncbi:MAG: PucR family transcriptional regulator [Demequinaceae bacterium]|nr:PucR family transcriptional regulator [Demequinaceae bacterium]